MKRTSETFSHTSIPLLKQQLLQWATQFDEVAWLDSNDYAAAYSNIKAVLAADALTVIKLQEVPGAFDALKEYYQQTKDWMFGYLSYDLKNDTEALTSKNYDGLEFASLYFFQPKRLIFIEEDTITFSYLGMVDDEIEADLEAIKNEVIAETVSQPTVEVQQRIVKEDYLKKVAVMQEHIHHGDIYEANMCMEFYAENVQLDTLAAYNHLNAISQPPFATYLKLQEHYLMSASPERYLMRQGSTVISQPIKGTIRRDVAGAADEILANLLENDSKERAENIMIVDLVRNDLSHFAQKGSVTVEELCKVYTFKQVHQLISTVKATLKDDTDSIDLIKSTFPMGSMTGAPKISAMNIIEELEETKRGLYSGAVGYLNPDGDFDFNVVIRSILYNAQKKYASFSVGSAITSLSVPENEYEECLLKAKAMKSVLEA